MTTAIIEELLIGVTPGLPGVFLIVHEGSTLAKPAAEITSTVVSPTTVVKRMKDE
jgi:hypothetical protein